MKRVVLHPNLNWLGFGNYKCKRKVVYFTKNEKFDKKKDGKQKELEISKMWEPISLELEKLSRNPKLGKYQKKYQSEFPELDEIGPKWIALGINAYYDEHVENSKYPLYLWLNPQRQDLYESGNYTVEEIKSWFNGEGKVIEDGTYPRLYKSQEIIGNVKAYPMEYYALCKCGYIHTDGNLKNRKEMLGEDTMKIWELKSQGWNPKILDVCPKCGKPGKDFIFCDDDPNYKI